MSRNLRNNGSILLAACLLFIPFLGAVHLFDWDEINFAESAREMIVTRNYFLVQIDYLPFWEKPPLFIWIQVLSMKIFGINEFAARFPNAVCGVATFLALFNVGQKLIKEEFFWIWTLMYVATPRFKRYAQFFCQAKKPPQRRAATTPIGCCTIFPKTAANFKIKTLAKETLVNCN